MNIPYRNAMKNTKDFVLNKNTTYSQGTKIKPSGFWYQINDCGYKHRQVEDGVPNWGKYIYKVEIDTSNILVIKNYQDYLKFDRKYGFDKKIKYSKKNSNVSNDNNVSNDSMTWKYIDWKKVAKKYAGFEVKNYDKIKEQLTKDNIKIIYQDATLNWLELFDFNSGCIWDLEAINSIKYCCKFSKKLQIENYNKKSRLSKKLSYSKRNTQTIKNSC